ncbi:hypothetical protein [Piscibacillus halophilus]|uniref:hypothetical protein n=1 Tax=Piscibacillus halophilus TaxID=571933 RepID=UPI0024092FE8|nr:hypothetical protein [Piscibacillus halophilus]
MAVKVWDDGLGDWVDATTSAPITAGATSATVTGLADDTYYYFYMVVTGGLRAGSSNAAGATTNPASVAPTPITDLSATGGNQKVTLNFSAPTGATSVSVKQRVEGETTWTDATTDAPITASSTSAVVTGLSDDTTYEFYLVVVDGDHAGDSNIASAKTKPASGSPTTPTPIADLSATGGAQKVTLNFTAPTGSTSVSVKQRIEGETTWADATTDAPITDTSTIAVVTGLAEDTTYEFYLVVVDGDHAGDSNIATAKTKATQVTPPSPSDNKNDEDKNNKDNVPLPKKDDDTDIPKNKVDTDKTTNIDTIREKQQSTKDSLSTTKEVEGKKLPKTATPWFNILLFSIVLLVGGVSTLLWRLKE